jgi:hypothetical protein
MLDFGLCAFVRVFFSKASLLFRLFFLVFPDAADALLILLDTVFQMYIILDQDLFP